MTGCSQRVFAGAAVLVLTIINILGVKQGKWTQNLLMTVKGLGLLAISCRRRCRRRLAVPAHPSLMTA